MRNPPVIKLELGRGDWLAHRLAARLSNKGGGTAHSIQEVFRNIPKSERICRSHTSSQTQRQAGQPAQPTERRVNDKEVAGTQQESRACVVLAGDGGQKRQLPNLHRRSVCGGDGVNDWWLGQRLHQRTQRARLQ